MTAAASEGQSVTVELSADAVILTPKDARLALLTLRYILEMDVHDRRLSADVTAEVNAVIDALTEQVGP